MAKWSYGGFICKSLSGNRTSGLRLDSDRFRREGLVLLDYNLLEILRINLGFEGI